MSYSRAPRPRLVRGGLAVAPLAAPGADLDLHDAFAPADAAAPPRARRRRGVALPWRGVPATAGALAEYGEFADSIWRGPLARGVRWSLVLVGFLAFVFTITTYKISIGDAAMIAALAGLLVQRQPLRVAPFVWTFAAFLGWVAVGWGTTEYSSTVWDTLYESIKAVAIALVAVNALRDVRQSRFFMVFFLACYALFPVRGTYFNFMIGHQYFGRYAWNYIYKNPNDLAALTLLVLSIAMAVLVRERRSWIRLGALGAIVVLPLLIVLTQSRGAMIAGFLTVVIAIAMQRRRRGRLLAGLVVAGVVIAAVAPDSVWTRVAGLRHVTAAAELDQADVEGSAASRFDIWRVAMNVWKSNPVIGVGYGTYDRAHGVAAAHMPGLHRGAYGRRDSHSTYVKLLAETGVVGLGLFLTMVGIVFRHADRVRRRLAVAVPAASLQIQYLELGLLSFMIAGIWGSFDKLTFLYLHLALLWCVADAYARTADAAGLPQRARA